jgi:virginiamycin B lyase
MFHRPRFCGSDYATVFGRGVALALFFAAALAACSGGNGGSGSSAVVPGAIATPPLGITPPPGQGSQPPATLAPVSAGSAVPAPAGSDLSNLLAGGASALPYVSALGATLTTPAPPSGSIAFGGIIQSRNGATLVIATTNSSAQGVPPLISANVALPPQVTAVIGSSTLIDSPGGASDLTPGTFVMVGGQLGSGSNLAATDVVPVTDANIAAGRARKPATLNLPRATRPSAQSSVYQAATTRGQLSTSDSSSLAFEQQIGVPGINGTASGAVPLGKCYDLDFSVTVVLGFGASYRWPMTVTAAEDAPIPVNSSGGVALTAQGSALTSTSPNVRITEGASEIVSASLVNSCLKRQISLPSIQAGDALSLNAAFPAQFGPSPVVLSNGTLTDPGVGNISCLAFSPITSWISLSFTKIGGQLCPRLSIGNGALDLGPVRSTGATVVSGPSRLSPQGSLTVRPSDENTLSFQLQASGPTYSYLQDAGLDFQLILVGQVVESRTLDLGPRTFAVPLSPQSGILRLTLSASRPTSTTPPTTPPTNPPTLPPTNPPTLPPTNPPTISPTNPPTQSPTTPPTTPPTVPPTAPPSDTPGAIGEYPIPLNNPNSLNDNYANGIAAGRDLALWFTFGSVIVPPTIGRMTTDGHFTKYPLSSSETQPWGIVAGPDGNLWFTEVSTNRIGRMSTSGVLLQEFTIPTPTSYPYGLVFGGDGNLWFIECRAGNNKIGRMTMSGQFQEFPVNAGINGTPEKITAGQDGGLWFTESDAGRIGRISTDGTGYKDYVIGNGAVGHGIAAGPDGALWFTSRDFATIGRITTSGQYSAYPVWFGGHQQEIVYGPDGAMWFTQQESIMGRITTSGQVTGYSVPQTDSHPFAITVGPDAAVWFTDNGGQAKQIGRVATSVAHRLTSSSNRRRTTRP